MDQNPRPRPLSVTLIGWGLIAAGLVGFGYHVTHFTTQGPFQYGLAWVCLLRLVAIAGGAFLLRGRNWARWLTLAWIAYHVILSALHSVSQTVTHAVLLAVVAYFLLRPPVSAFFRRSPPR